MALAEQDHPLKPVFEIECIPCYQFCVLKIELNNSSVFRIRTYEGNLNWGLEALYIGESGDIQDKETNPFSIYRNTSITRHPKGIIEDVIIKLSDSGDISEVWLELDNTFIILKAGEFYENNDQTVHLTEEDESVILFLSEDDYNSLDFGKNSTYPLPQQGLNGFELFRQELYTAMSQTFSKVMSLTRHEELYFLGLYVGPDCSYFHPTALTKETLERVYQNAIAKNKTAGIIDEDLLLKCKWNGSLSPYYKTGFEYFDTLNTISDEFNEIIEYLKQIQYNHVYFLDDIGEEIKKVFMQLIEDGKFGSETERKGFLIGALQEEFDFTLTPIACELNSDALYKEYIDDMCKLY